MTQIVWAWVIVTGVTVLFQVNALIDARADQVAVNALNGAARELGTEMAVRREAFALFVVGLLFLAALPAVFYPDPVTRPESLRLLSIGFLMLAPVVLLLASIIDRRDRRRMTLIIASELGLAAAVESGSIRRLLADIGLQLAENTAISQGARDDAHEAAEVANHVNEKIASLDKALLRQGSVAIERNASVEATIDDTAEKVADIHDATVGKEPA